MQNIVKIAISDTIFKLVNFFSSFFVAKILSSMNSHKVFISTQYGTVLFIPSYT